MTPDAAEVLSLTGSDLAGRVGALIRDSLPVLAVRGRLTKGVQAGSGHLYFTLVDGPSKFRCVMYRGRAKKLSESLPDNVLATVTGRAIFYESLGTVELIVTEVKPDGR